MEHDYISRKSFLIDRLGGKCVRCGATSGLHFDHVDPSTKLFPVTQGLKGRRWESVLAEVSKCQLLCAPCHRTKSRENDELGGNRKLDRAGMLELRRRYDSGEGCTTLAAEYGVSPATVCMIGKRKRWGHVKG